ncbi:CBL-interacting serine/threonine-protein kinase 5 [Abeliophyllum distichum]|uniref:non-specific serine/threonine protein kinase n=1 Tax=Abeliophyllum distichum TaxID=126358 RepID=A0ABD1PFL7_9LAMI
MYSKVFKAKFEFPPWFSYDVKRLISRLLVADPEKRISIQGIMRVPWFFKGFTRSVPVAFSIQEPVQENFMEQKDDDSENTNSSPPFYNAFEFISSMSSGFDLSSLFENRKKSGSLFTSKCSCSVIMDKLESLAKKLNFRIMIAKDYKVKMQSVSEGRKGKLSVTAEVFEVAPEVAVVEFSKSAGDTFEYRKLYEEDLRPALKDIVWSWQGECNNQE